MYLEPFIVAVAPFGDFLCKRNLLRVDRVEIASEEPTKRLLCALARADEDVRQACGVE